MMPEETPRGLYGQAVRLFSGRFIKFASVGFSGTLINLTVLYFCQECFLRSIENPGLRLNLSLAAAISVATINNFILNRLWTWRDRKKEIRRSIFVQLAQYFAACWLSIVIQFILTSVMASFIHYLAANLLAIVTAAVVNYLINDAWTFRISRSS
ncbi:MAG: GtrA family protein [Deltaproteobacteria bacterium]|nr:GtrA family protein [Deltaproteobacteria bacterium]